MICKRCGAQHDDATPCRHAPDYDVRGVLTRAGFERSRSPDLSEAQAEAAWASHQRIYGSADVRSG